MLFNNVRFQFPQEDLGTPSPSGPSKSSCSVPRDIRTGGDASPSRLTLVKAGNVFKTRLQPRSCHLEALLETEPCVRQWQGDCASRASVDLQGRTDSVDRGSRSSGSLGCDLCALRLE